MNGAAGSFWDRRMRTVIVDTAFAASIAAARAPFAMLTLGEIEVISLAAMILTLPVALKIPVVHDTTGTVP